MPPSKNRPGQGEPATHVEVEGRRLRLTNLDKVLYPATGFTKGQVVDYYTRIAPTMLPHLHDRPVTMLRLPDGVTGERFFEKRCPGHRPAWLDTVPLDADSDVAACSLDSSPPSCGRRTSPPSSSTPPGRGGRPVAPDRHRLRPRPRARGRPGRLRPGRTRAPRPPRAARARGGGEDVGLQGLHLSVGLRPSADAETTKAFALALGKVLESRDPKRVTVTMARDQRPGHVFVDWSQNDRHKTTVCAYSLRATDAPGVSTPVSWDELHDAADSGDADALVFTPADALTRVEEHGDLYADSLAHDQDLPELG